MGIWWRDRRGQSLLLVVGGLSALIGLAGMAIDTGSWYVAGQRLQSAVDAAALAGAHDLPGNASQAVTDAITAAGKNGITLTSADVSVSSTNPNEISVTAHATAPTFFTKIFGMDGVPETATANAADSFSTALNYALFSQSTTTSIKMTGNATVNGNVHANYNDPPVDAVGNPHINGTVTGTPVITLPTVTWSQIEAQNPTIIDNGDSSSDANAGDPAGDACNNTLSLAGNGSLIPASGVVVVMGNVDLTGNITFSGTLIAWGGNLTVTGNVTAAAQGPYALMALDNPAEDTGACAGSQGGITLTGNASVAGAVWADGPVEITGNPSVAGSVVGNTIAVTGNQTVTWDPKDIGAIPFGNPWLVP